MFDVQVNVCSMHVCATVGFLLSSVGMLLHRCVFAVKVSGSFCCPGDVRVWFGLI